MNKTIYESVWRSVGVAFWLSLSDTRARYKRSVLGPLWITIATGVGTIGLGFIWGALLRQNAESIIPQLTYGIVLWQFMSSCITEAPQAYQQLGGIIKNQRHPIYMYPLLVIFKNIINLFHNAIIVCVVELYFGTFSYNSLPSLIIGTALMLLNIFWIVSIISILGTRYRDVSPLITTCMPIIVFITPVIYRPVQLGELGFLMWLNPFTYLITIIRDPLLGEVVSGTVYLGAVAMGLVGMVVTALVFRVYGRRVPFWV